MYFLLRTIRALIGVVAAFEVFNLINKFITLVLLESANAEIFGFFLARVVIIIIAIIMFIGLRKFINYLHIKKHGNPHPALEKKSLSL